MKPNLFPCWRQASLVAMGLGLALPLTAFAQEEQAFNSPNDAINALVEAAQEQ